MSSPEPCATVAARGNDRRRDSRTPGGRERVHHCRSQPWLLRRRSQFAKKNGRRAADVYKFTKRCCLPFGSGQDAGAGMAAHERHRGLRFPRCLDESRGARRRRHGHLFLCALQVPPGLVTVTDRVAVLVLPLLLSVTVSDTLEVPAAA